ncbi:hypothetical protein OQX61_14965 [Pedobacter sp. PLR]|uniref:hypothetical protein n=1 Tax=Pedobacter sp. PLR TaxID=2994465 RepID=UPI00224603CA|nr:hypothetical protein [Pedobacter sp. PLR]MCX2452576.1 hypothetical protein [Pedobacter sp. PLR]
MKVQFPVVGLLSGMLLFGCNSSENKVNSTDTVATENKSTAIPADATANTLSKADQKTVDLVKLKLTTMFKDELAKNLIDTPGRKFKFFEYDLNGDAKKEIFVGLTGSNFCGSGGCTMLLLSPEGELITRFTVVDYPIQISNTMTKGWKDLILHSNSKDHLMKFDGKAYPANPSIQPVYTANSSTSSVKGLDASDQLYTW